MESRILHHAVKQIVPAVPGRGDPAEEFGIGGEDRLGRVPHSGDVLIKSHLVQDQIAAETACRPGIGRQHQDPAQSSGGIGLDLMPRDLEIVSVPGRLFGQQTRAADELRAVAQGIGQHGDGVSRQGHDPFQRPGGQCRCLADLTRPVQDQNARTVIPEYFQLIRSKVKHLPRQISCLLANPKPFMAIIADITAAIIATTVTFIICLLYNLDCSELLL